MQQRYEFTIKARYVSKSFCSGCCNVVEDHHFCLKVVVTSEVTRGLNQAG